MRAEEIETGNLPSARVIAFPLARRVTAVRRAAEAILSQPTLERQDRIRHRIAEILFASLSRSRIGEQEQDESVGAFFTAVDLQIDAADSELMMQAPGE